MIATADYLAAVQALPFGKRLPNAVYLLDLDDARIPHLLRAACRELRRRFEIGPEFNLLKFHHPIPKVSFLSYPSFFEDAHPSLHASVSIDLVSGRIRRDDYRTRANPPILHRKDTFIPFDHEAFAKFRSLTEAEETAGLLADTARIGFRLNWERALQERGVELRGHRLVEAVGGREKDAAPRNLADVVVERHRTAIARTEVSKPVKMVLEAAQLRSGETLFDYGCGLGGDIAALDAMGHAVSGWDPVHAPARPKAQSDVVNLGFVLNVIEDPAERVDVLLDAWALARRLLVVSVLMSGQEGYDDIRPCGDGVITSRKTFQKHFEPAEIQALIEDTLHGEAIPVAWGIYFVFRQFADQHDFLASRTKRYLDWESLSRRLGLYRAIKAARDPYETHRELLDDFWQTAIALGRVPRTEEFDRLEAVREACGSVPKAIALFVERFGQATFDAARVKRREDTLVYVAASRLRKRIPFAQLSQRLQRDIRSFFGSYPEAEKQALDVMFAAGDVDELALAVQQLGFGWWDAQEQQFTVHRSLLDELPAILRVYVECAARLFGNPRETDLIKFHLRSRKLTFQTYDDFDGAPFPELRMRIKIDLPRMFVTVLEQRHVSERQILYFKERFVGADHPGRVRMEQVSERLKTLGFDRNTIGYGPTRQEFEEMLRQRNLDWALRKKPTRAG